MITKGSANLVITEQEKAQTKVALKEEISRHSKLISLYEARIKMYEKVDGGEREVSRCTAMIEKSKRTIEVAAAELGISPVEKRGPGRPPKSSYQQ